jgi:hypothetical protein
LHLLERLDLYVLGDRLHRERAVEQLACKRLIEKKPQVEIPDHLQPRRHKVRVSSRTPSVTPNAPLLKRLVKNPQQMDRGHFTRSRLDRYQLQKRERPSAAALFREAMAVDRRVEKIRPMELHLKPVARLRPSVGEWLGGQDHD